MINEKSFEEEFPELKDKSVEEITFPSVFEYNFEMIGGQKSKFLKNRKNIIIRYKNGDIKNLEEGNKENTLMFNILDIQKHCRSNQKIKEAINKAFDTNIVSSPNHRKRILLQELNLEE